MDLDSKLKIQLDHFARQKSHHCGDEYELARSKSIAAAAALCNHTGIGIVCDEHQQMLHRISRFTQKTRATVWVLKMYVL